MRGMKNAAHQTASVRFVNDHASLQAVRASSRPLDTLPSIIRIQAQSYSTSNSSTIGGFSLPAAKSLREVVKYSLFQKADYDELKRIWMDYHKDHATAIGEILSSSQAEALEQQIRKYPRFVYPVMQPTGGFFVLYAQWQGNHCFMTFLEEFRQNPARAQPWFIISIYTELMKTKGLAFLRGEVFLQRMSKPEAEQVMRRFKEFYMGDKSHVDLLQKFNSKPEDFDFKDLLKKCT